ncbi:MAG: hypothetical protein HOW97_38320, partial [Catenulispora sp.]|nr:hypothetical protein [Catenulispora sp.]
AEAVVAAAVRRAAVDPRDPWRGIGLLGRDVRPAPPTEQQLPVLGVLAALNGPRRLAVLRHLLEGAALTEVADTPSDVESVRTGLDLVCQDRPAEEVTALLLGPELDPVRIPVFAADVAARRRRRRRRRWAALGVLVLAAGAAGWWFEVRVPPLGTYADDPRVQQAPTLNDVGVDGWIPRGELLGDAALLRRAAQAWHHARADELALGHGPTVLFAGRVRDITAVVMDDRGAPVAADGERIAVYVEGADGRISSGPDNVDTRITVNLAASDPVFAGGIRLFEADPFRTDPVLLPPGASDVRVGALDAPVTSWQPIQPDARGVIEVPVPQYTAQQAVRPNWSPSGGIRYQARKYLITAGDGPVTLAETFSGHAPLLPVIKTPDFSFPGGPLSAADMCVARKQAEYTPRSPTAPEWVTLVDVATGPLPGGATGYVIRRSVRAAELTMDYTSTQLLAMSGGSCADAYFTSPEGVAWFSDGSSFPSDADFTDNTALTSPSVAAVFWETPDKHTYLVVAGGPKVARLKVSGPVPGQADGRWLVIPMPQGYYGPPAAELNSVEGLDAAGHVCGQKDSAGEEYCG